MGRVLGGGGETQGGTAPTTTGEIVSKSAAPHCVIFTRKCVPCDVIKTSRASFSPRHNECLTSKQEFLFLLQGLKIKAKLHFCMLEENIKGSFSQSHERMKGRRLVARK